MPKECTGHSKHSNNTREGSTHGHHQMVNSKIRLIIFFAAKDREALYSQQKQDQELIVAQIMNSLLQTTVLSWRNKIRPFRYNLNQILYDYTVKVTNTFKGLVLIEYLMNYRQRFLTLYRRQWLRPSPKNKMQKGKMVVWGWMASLTQWTWVWAISRSWWWTGKSGVLQSMGSQRVGHHYVTELNW